MKTFVITGAGSGIGKATAILLSQDPEIKLVLVGRREPMLQETLAAMLHHQGHIAMNLDVRSADDWKKKLNKIAGEMENVYGVFANAGMGGENHYGKEDTWEEIISTNLTGTYLTVQHLLPWMRQSTEKFRHVVITSSCLARFGVAGYSAYCTAKTGLLGLTKAWALEWASEHILVNAICPGWVDTGMAQAGIQKLADAQNISYEKSFSDQMSYVPLNKISAPIEIAQMVRFLTSELQTSITGQGLDINNGSFMI